MKLKQLKTYAICAGEDILWVLSMAKHAIFLNGPVGVGKTTLGQALAEAIGGGFIDGDDHSAPDRPWYGSILQTSRAIVATGLSILETHPSVVIAYPLSCVNWIYHKRRFEEAGIRPLFIGLRASYEGIVSPVRSREFSPEEQARIKIMLQEGYSERPFNDLILDTDKMPFDLTVRHLKSEIMKAMGII